MNRWEKAISDIDDQRMKKILDTVIALKKQYEFRYQLSNMTGFTDVDGNGKILATAELLEIFVKRELGCRMKKRAAEKKEAENG